MANVDALAALSSEEMRRLLEEQKRKQAMLKASFSSDFGATPGSVNTALKYPERFSSDFATTPQQRPYNELQETIPKKRFNDKWLQQSPGTKSDFTPASIETIESPTNMYNLHPRGEGEFYGTPTVPLDQYESRTGVGSSQYQRDIAAAKLKGMSIGGIKPDLDANLTDEQKAAKAHALKIQASITDARGAGIDGLLDPPVFDARAEFNLTAPDVGLSLIHI